MQIVSENVLRNLDARGRIMIPKGTRDRLQMQDNMELEIFIITDDNGKKYIGLSNKDFVDPKYTVAAEVLKELNVDIPNELLQKIKTY